MTEQNTDFDGAFDEPSVTKSKAGRPKGSKNKKKQSREYPEPIYHCDDDQAFVEAVYDYLWRRYDKSGQVIKLRADQIVKPILLQGEAFVVGRLNQPHVSILSNRVPGIVKERVKTKKHGVTYELNYLYLDDDHSMRQGWWYRGRLRTERYLAEESKSSAGLSKTAIRKRLLKGMPVEQAVHEPKATDLNIPGSIPVTKHSNSNQYSGSNQVTKFDEDGWLVVPEPRRSA